MILVFGGVYQGKLDYVRERFSLQDSDIFFCTDDDATHPAGKKVIYEIDKWLLALLREGYDVTEQIDKFVKNNQNAIIICNDISCGIVPVEPVMRKWREEVGWFLVTVAKNSDEVIRLYCGIPTRLK